MLMQLALLGHISLALNDFVTGRHYLCLKYYHMLTIYVIQLQNNLFNPSVLGVGCCSPNAVECQALCAYCMLNLVTVCWGRVKQV